MHKRGAWLFFPSQNLQFVAVNNLWTDSRLSPIDAHPSIRTDGFDDAAWCSTAQANVIANFWNRALDTFRFHRSTA
jgi:hypothetical protein